MRRNSPTYIRELVKELRNNQTTAERKLWNSIRRKQLGGFRFLRQYAIGRYIVDFYCSQARLAIELDGKIHEFKEQQEYDSIRDKIIETYQIEIVRFSNEQIFNSLDEVLKQILDILNARCSKALQN